MTDADDNGLMKQFKSIVVSVVLAIACMELSAQTNTPTKPAWTVWNCYERTPDVGHIDGKVSFKCRFCGWKKTFSWHEHFWDNSDEPILMKHIEVFHVLDIHRSTNP